jgi:hypothetical protein
MGETDDGTTRRAPDGSRDPTHSPPRPWGGFPPRITSHDEPRTSEVAVRQAVGADPGAAGSTSRCVPTTTGDSDRVPTLTGAAYNW